MIRVSDVVNSLLKGISLARVKSDLASAAISKQYLDDPDLDAFPVPRAEIRQAEIDVKYAITETVDRVVDEEGEALLALIDALTEYVTAVFARPVKETSNSPASSYRPLSEFLGDREPEVRASFTGWMESYFETNITTVYTQLIESPQRFGRQYLSEETYTALNTITSSLGIVVFLGDSDWRRNVRNDAIAWSGNAYDAVALAIETARARYFDLDLAIKKDQLVNVAAQAMSSMKLNVYIQNYEWVTSRDSEGNPINKLALK